MNNKKRLSAFPVPLQEVKQRPGLGLCPLSACGAAARGSFSTALAVCLPRDRTDIPTPHQAGGRGRRNTSHHAAHRPFCGHLRSGRCFSTRPQPPLLCHAPAAAPSPRAPSYLPVLRWVSIAKGAGDHQDHGFMLQVHDVVLVHGHHLGATEVLARGPGWEIHLQGFPWATWMHTQ